MNNTATSGTNKTASRFREADAELISTFSQRIAKQGAADLESEGEEIQVLALLGQGTVSGLPQDEEERERDGI